MVLSTEIMSPFLTLSKVFIFMLTSISPEYSATIALAQFISAVAAALTVTLIFLSSPTILLYAGLYDITSASTLYTLYVFEKRSLLIVILFASDTILFLLASNTFFASSMVFPLYSQIIFALFFTTTSLSLEFSISIGASARRKIRKLSSAITASPSAGTLESLFV